ncbi:ribosomal protein S6 kinase alpha-5-like isoform X2 [Dermacentor andersoni]|uniref:ribosomal protein S6 kinase alpha-5-like isoform X2 n=1 Tax=Dermacentor andersoni TaxID=34620 RepID=UPI002155CE67|nr:ribosomal protein S6 kinase alpha-5-like isoform X2 [Dermacentor andersoni]
MRFEEAPWSDTRRTTGYVLRKDPVNLAGHGKVDMSNFELLRVLGTGAYGKVFLVRKVGGQDHGKLYAMKVLKKASIVQKQKTLEHTRTERQVLEAIRQSPFLVTLHYAFQTDAKLHLILDYVSGGELFTHLYQRDHFTESEVRIYIGEIVLALEHLHKLGIIYRDIKLENILLDSQGHIVLTDFGLSKEFLPHEKDQRAYSFCGTIEYMAPEVVRGGSTGHDFSVDWWSVGVLTYELLTGASPFTVEGERNNQAEISKLASPEKPEEEGSLSTDVLIRRILKSQPPIPDSISGDIRDFIQKLLIKDPRKRLGGGLDDALEIKRHRFFKGLDWEDLATKRIAAPFVPKIAGELDVSNFAEEFTSMVPADSPGLAPVSDDKVFKGYSYVAPSVLFSDNILTDELLGCPSESRPNISQLLAAKFKNSAFFQNYDLIAREGILGDGSYSVCRKCINKKTGLAYAVKIVSRRIDTTQEVQLLKMCQGHTNVVQFVEAFQDEAHTYIVLELLTGGELLDRIRRRARFTESEACRIFRRLVSAVHFMHSRGVVHRDLKPENLLFTDSSENATIKVVDFGFARLKPQDNQLMKTPCFTLNYAAPEVLRQASPGNAAAGYSESCDLWSLGVILYTMLSGRAPFQTPSRNASAAALMQRIREGEFSFNGPQWEPVSDQAKDVIRGLLTVEAPRRLTMAELRAHPWVHSRSSHWSASLMTPDVLSSSSSPRAAESAVRATFDAFHLATRGGFRLLDVSAAPLAQRRRLKRNSADVRSDSSVSTSSGSSFTSTSSSSSSASLSSAAAASTRSLGFVPAREDSARSVDSVFTYPETKVAAYLSTLPDVVERPSESGITDDIETMTVDLATTGLAAPSVNSSKPETPTLPATVATDLPESLQGKEARVAAFSLPTIPEAAETSDDSRAEIMASTEQALLDPEGPITRSRRKRPSPQDRTTVPASFSDDGSEKSEPNTKKSKKRSPQKSSPSRKQR